MLTLFDRHYKTLILHGLTAVIWFSVFAKAAHDLWSASVVFAVTTFLTVLFCIGRYRDQKPIRLPLIFPMLLCLLAILLSGWHAYDIDAFKLEGWGWFFVVVFFYLFVNTVDNENDRSRFYTLTGNLLVPLAILCLWQQLYYGRWEISGTLINSIVLAGFTLYWPLILCEQRSQSRWTTFLFLCSVLILLLAKSWWSFIALFTGFGIYYRAAIVTWVIRRKAMAFFLGSLLLSLFIALLWQKAHRSIGSPFYSEANRLSYWAIALQMWLQNPWTGVGLGGFSTAFRFLGRPDFQSTLFAHSFPLQWLSETGCAGFVAAALFIFSYIRMPKKPSVYGTTLIMVLIYSLISFNMDFFVNKCLLMIMLASAHSFEPVSGRPARRLWLGAVSLCLFLLVPFWASLLTASRLYMAGLELEQQGDLAGAVRKYQLAISINPSQADSFQALSRHHWKTYQRTHSDADLAAAYRYILSAFDNRKDPRFLQDMKTYSVPKAPL